MAITDMPAARAAQDDSRADVGWKAMGVIVFASLLAWLAFWSTSGNLDDEGAARDVSELAGLWVYGALGVFLLALALGPGVVERAGTTAARFRRFGGLFYFLALPAIAADWLLRNPIAWIIGVNLRGLVLRYGLIFLHVGLAAFAVWVVPREWPEYSYLSFVGLGWAFVASIAVVRKWMWVEAQFEAASDRMNGVDASDLPDLRDEALVSLLLFFAAVPVALWQANTLFDLFVFTGEGTPSPFHWIGFFGAELVKAVPLVDWAEVYEVGSETHFHPNGAAGRHVVFVTRIIVDLVLLGALLHALERMGRISRQRREFDAGLRTLVDPFLENKIFAGLVAQARARAGSWVQNQPPVQLGHLANYDLSRLVARAASGDADVRALALHAANRPGAAVQFSALAQDRLKKESHAGVVRLIVHQLRRNADWSALTLLAEVATSFGGLSKAERFRVRVEAAAAVSEIAARVHADPQNRKAAESVIEKIGDALGDSSQWQTRAAIARAILASRIPAGFRKVRDHFAWELKRGAAAAIPALADAMASAAYAQSPTVVGHAIDAMQKVAKTYSERNGPANESAARALGDAIDRMRAAAA